MTNVAILVNGIKPIGARGRVLKSQKNSIKIVMKNSSQDDEENLLDNVCFEFHLVNDFKDYNKPTAVACLMKAVCVFTKLVELNGDENLSDQLERKVGGSLILHTWTGLPHGSGLGKL